MKAVASRVESGNEEDEGDVELGRGADEDEDARVEGKRTDREESEERVDIRRREGERNDMVAGLGGLPRGWAWREEGEEKGQTRRA